jgi:hypothetical protein
MAQLFSSHVFDDLWYILNDCLRISYFQHIVQIKLGLVISKPLFSPELHLFCNSLQLFLIKFFEPKTFWPSDHHQTGWNLYLLNNLVNHHQAGWNLYLLNNMVNHHGLLMVDLHIVDIFHFLWVLLLILVGAYSSLGFAMTIRRLDAHIGLLEH